MIDWSVVKDLLVIKKLEQIVGKWFGVDLVYTDHYGRIQSDVLKADHKFYSQLFSLQMKSPHGAQSLQQDIERAVEYFEEHKVPNAVIPSSFAGVDIYVSEVVSDGDVLGYVFAFPFITQAWTHEHMQTYVKQMVEGGANEVDVKFYAEKVFKLPPAQVEYLKELVQVVGEEFSSFHHEISKRDERISELNSELGTKFRYHNMIGKSKAMQKIYHLLDKIKTSEATIMIQGENGTGKELVAKAIHFGSPRKDAVFLAVNCSAFNDNLLDSELFGHVKGAFTGAVKDKKGFFEMANGGTLFLDEIGDTSLAMQVKLLRVLQEGTFLPVGSAQPRKVNVRVIAATNKPLKEMIARGEFREDLYYRINVINVNLPPLRERFEDIPFLMEYFLEKQCAEMGHPTKQFSKKCIEKMLDYKWPGNVRELQNEVERLVVLAGEDKIVTPDLLSSRITDSLEANAGTPSGLKGINTNGSLKDALEELERMMIREGLKRTNFNKSKLAKELGVSRAGLIMKVEKYELDKRKKAAGEE